MPIIVDAKENGWTKQNGIYVRPPQVAAPKAVFDANVTTDVPLGRGLSSGHIKILESHYWPDGRLKNPNIMSPDGINRGWEVGYTRTSSATGNNGGREINYQIMNPSAYTAHYMRIWQPSNFYKRRICYITVNDISEAANWQQGDRINNGGSGYGLFFSAEVDGNKHKVYLDKHGGGHPANVWGSGRTLHNERNGETITSIGSGFEESGTKFMSEWVDDSYANGGGHDGYSNSGFISGMVAPTPDEDDVDGSGYVTISATRSFGFYTFDADGNVIDKDEIKGPGGNLTSHQTKLYDTQDNGHWINWVLEKQRSSGYQVNDGWVRMWKMVERPGSPHAEWTLVEEATGVHQWSPHQNNRFTHGYMFGYCGAGWYEDTSFLVNRWEYWNQTPAFLPEIPLNA